MGGRQLQSQEAEDRIRHSVLNGPPGAPGLSDRVTLSPRVPQAGGGSLQPALPASRRPHPPPRRRPGSSASGAASFGTEASRCPARRRSRVQPPPRRLGRDPRELGGPSAAAPGARPPRAARAPPCGARGAKPTEQSAARTAEWRTRGSGRAAAPAAGARAQARRAGTPGPWLQRDAAPAPSSGRRRCSCSVCRASLCGRMVSVRGVPGVARGVRVGKATLAGVLPPASLAGNDASGARATLCPSPDPPGLRSPQRPPPQPRPVNPSSKHRRKPVRWSGSLPLAFRRSS